jgi:hypothetical protein
VRGRELLCREETYGARQRLVVRDENLSEEPPPSQRLVGEASYCSETRRLASEGLDRALQSSLC